MSKEKVDENALICEMVTLHYMEHLFDTPLEVIKDFIAYNSYNNVSSGFNELKVTEMDVGKTVLEYLVDILPYFGGLAKYHYNTILSMPESIKEE